MPGAVNDRHVRMGAVGAGCDDFNRAEVGVSIVAPAEGRGLNVVPVAEDDGRALAEGDFGGDERGAGAVGIASVKDRAPAPRGVLGAVCRHAELPAVVIVGRDRPSGGVALHVVVGAEFARGHHEVAVFVGVGRIDDACYGGRVPDVAVAGLVDGEDAHVVEALSKVFDDHRVRRGVRRGFHGGRSGERGRDIYEASACGVLVDVVAAGRIALVRLVGLPTHGSHAVVAVAQADIRESGCHVIDDGRRGLGGLLENGHVDDVAVRYGKGRQVDHRRVLIPARHLADEGEFDFYRGPDKAAFGGNGQDGREMVCLRGGLVGDFHRRVGAVGLAVEDDAAIGAAQALEGIAEEIGLEVDPAQCAAHAPAGVAFVRNHVRVAHLVVLLLEDGIPEPTLEAVARTVVADAIGAVAVPAVARVPDAGEGAVAGGGGEMLRDAVLVECAGDAPLRVDEERRLVAQRVRVLVFELHVVVVVAVAEVVDDGDAVAGDHGAGKVGNLPVAVLRVERRQFVGVEEVGHVHEAPGALAVAEAGVGRADAHLLKHGLGVAVGVGAQKLADEKGGARVGGAGGAVLVVLAHLVEPILELKLRLDGDAADFHLRVEVDFAAVGAVVNLAVNPVAVAVEVAVEALVVEVRRDFVHVAGARVAVKCAGRNDLGVAA